MPVVSTFATQNHAVISGTLVTPPSLGAEASRDFATGHGGQDAITPDWF